MNEDLSNEIDAINSIYGPSSLIFTPETSTCILRIPSQSTSLRLEFPSDYPNAPPAVLGTQSSGESTRKGEASHVADVFRDALARLYEPGEVCLFQTIEEVNGILEAADAAETQDKAIEPVETTVVETTSPDDISGIEPPWTLSEIITELKSVFIARSAPVTSPSQANAYLQHLLSTDKKVRAATHNITAWRIRGENGATYQDCDDDGETAAGGRVLHLMQLMDVWDVMIVVTRWYGGHQLGPKRFSIINAVARDALVRGDFVKVEGAGGKKKGKK